MKVIPNQSKTYEKMACEEEERESKVLKGTSLIFLSEKITCTERAPAECDIVVKIPRHRRELVRP